jgi:hypothetical protein
MRAGTLPSIALTFLASSNRGIAQDFIKPTASTPGSACDPSQPAAIGCQSVNQDAKFQENLAQFIVRNDHNPSYATFLFMFSYGFGYSFSGTK